MAGFVVKERIVPAGSRCPSCHSVMHDGQCQRCFPILSQHCCSDCLKLWILCNQSTRIDRHPTTLEDIHSALLHRECIKRADAAAAAAGCHDEQQQRRQLWPQYLQPWQLQPVLALMPQHPPPERPGEQQRQLSPNAAMAIDRQQIATPYYGPIVRMGPLYAGKGINDCVRCCMPDGPKSDFGCMGHPGSLSFGGSWSCCQQPVHTQGCCMCYHTFPSPPEWAIRPLFEKEQPQQQWPQQQQQQQQCQQLLLAHGDESKWLWKHSELELLERIGKGNFGDVMKARVRASGEFVAVKQCLDQSAGRDEKKFMAEAEILRQYDHPNIVRIIGITDTKPLYILMELCVGGCFLDFLQGLTRLREADRSLPADLIVRLLRYSVDSAAGMAYLQSKNCVHRDVAARNCLVGDNECIKISDFGMSRMLADDSFYQMSVASAATAGVPVRWTAPEVFASGKFNSQSDVWSYGILLWETFSLGETPYASKTNAVVRDEVIKGFRMRMPVSTPDSVAALVAKCWEANPANRPDFRKIHSQLVELLIERETSV
eukprot:m.199323 g.199323  ORF g.199323 m.199323 type:complete len:543 (+) comp17681_c1_seq2:184-1812(+)